jgi:hypothetical protein
LKGEKPHGREPQDEEEDVDEEDSPVVCLLSISFSALWDMIERVCDKKKKRKKKSARKKGTEEIGIL